MIHKQNDVTKLNTVYSVMLCTKLPMVFFAIYWASNL